MTHDLLALYRDRLAKGEIEPDAAQRAAAERLSGLADALAQWTPPGNGLLNRIGLRASRSAPRGLYIHGEVGRGKTMLMDLFFESVAVEAKRRDHFHEFMADVHDAIAEARKSDPGDPIPHVAKSIAAGAGLLCLDELHVTDIADAMIVGRLFEALFSREAVVVATSNAAPDDLYPNGLNRQLFLPFIRLLEQRLDILELAAAKDYRLEKLSGTPLYFTPADDKARVALDALWERLTGHHPPAPHDLTVKGRKVRVPLASMGVARFSFAELCQRPLAAIDYLAIAHGFHTLVISDIPVLPAEARDATRRFMNLIDTLYDNGVCLVASAEAEPHALCASGPVASTFERTASRLVEMRSESYLRDRHAGLTMKTAAKKIGPSDERSDQSFSQPM